jgi:hypothetical protein
MADRHGFDLSAIRHRRDEPRRADNDVVVGQQIPVGGEDDTRTDAARLALLVNRRNMRDGGADPLERVSDARRIRIERVVRSQNIKWHANNVMAGKAATTRSNGG